MGTDAPRGFFHGWTIEGLVIVFLIFFREYLVDGFNWLRNKYHASVDRKVMAYLGSLDRGVKKTSEEIVVGINDAKISGPKVAASLQRLSDKSQVENDEKGGWYKSRRYVPN